MRAVRRNAFPGPADLVIEEIEPPTPDLPFTAGSEAAAMRVAHGTAFYGFARRGAPLATPGNFATILEMKSLSCFCA